MDCIGFAVRPTQYLGGRRQVSTGVSWAWRPAERSFHLPVTGNLIAGHAQTTRETIS
jgi:hypothetical protein